MGNGGYTEVILMKKKILSLAVLLSLVTVQTQVNAGGGKVAAGVGGGILGGVLLSQMLRSNNSNSDSDDGEVVEVKSSRKRKRSKSAISSNKRRRSSASSSCSRCKSGCNVSNKGKSQKRRCLGGCSRKACSIRRK